MERVLEVQHLGKSFGSNVVLRDIDFAVSTGDVTCVIGASGSGKSTLLRCINLLETPTCGEILFHGLFFMTGIAIVLYLNQTPSQPRERDYAYAGSFYAFAIWIGRGVAGLVRLLQDLSLIHI